MEKRIRSPNYPAFSLTEALAKVQLIYKAQHTHGAPREVVVKSMGYAGINGASATAISALHKYGLLERAGEEVKISERAMRYLHPNDDHERPRAIREAAFDPPLFQELADKFPGRMPSEDVLRNYLVRKGFAPAALSGVILAYRDTMELVEREGGAYDSGQTTAAPEPQMQPQSPPPGAPPPPASGRAAAPANRFDVFTMKGAERSLGRLDFPEGGFVQILYFDVDEEDALEGVETLVTWTKKQIAKRKALPAAPPSADEEVDT